MPQESTVQGGRKGAQSDLGHGFQALFGVMLVRLCLLLLEGELGVLSQSLVQPLSKLHHLLVERQDLCVRRCAPPACTAQMRSSRQHPPT